jgi:hypothetical protein
MKLSFIGREFEKGHFNAYLKKIEEEISEDQYDGREEQKISSEEVALAK